MTPVSRHVVWKMFCGNTPTSPEVIVENTLNFKTNFKFLRLKFFLGGPPSQLRCSLGSLGQSVARLKISGRSTPQWPKCSLQKNVHVGWSIWANRTFLFLDQSSHHFLPNVEGIVVDQVFQIFDVSIPSRDIRDQSRKLSIIANLDIFGCPKFLKFYWLILNNPHGHFSVDYISAIGGCCALKFLNVLETDQGYLVQKNLHCRNNQQFRTRFPKKQNVPHSQQSALSHSFIQSHMNLSW